MQARRLVARWSVPVLAAAAITAASLGAAARIGDQRGGAAHPADGPPPIDKTFAAYAAGNYDVVERVFATPDDFRFTEKQLHSLLIPWLADWRPVRATFLIELAIAASRAGASQAVPMLVAEGGDFVVRRPTRFGADAGLDRFEATWHRTAIGVLQGEYLAVRELQYVADVEKRYKNAQVPNYEPRLALARAIAEEQSCCTPQRFLAADGGRGLVSTTALVSPTGASEPMIETATRAFENAARTPGVREEALVRRAVLMEIQGHAAQALACLADVKGSTDDRELSYWAEVARGRALDALQRPAEAVEAFRTALTWWPHGQSAVLGLAVNLLRTNRRADAAAAVTELARVAANATDPWWQIDAGDARFVPAWLSVLRSASR